MENLVPLDAIGAPATEAPAASLSDSLDGQAFLNLFVAQLQYQNPLEPSGGTEMMLQTAQFSQVEMLTQLLESQQQLMGMSQVTAAINMVGNEVSAALPEGPVTGIVDGYRLGEDGPVLLVGDKEIPIELAAEVRRST